jgi:hypothetical protein
MPRSLPAAAEGRLREREPDQEEGDRPERDPEAAEEL